MSRSVKNQGGWVSAFLLALFGPAAPESPPPKPAGPPIFLCFKDLAPHLIADVIQRQHSAVRHCTTRTRTRQPELAGKLVVQLTVRDGFVQDAHLKQDDIGDEALAACVLDTFWLMHVPLSEQHNGREFVVTYPFLFIHAETREQQPSQASLRY